ncbi:MAG: putative glycolipid-binding domain-containing protein [Pseudomonadota bacterium]
MSLSAFGLGAPERSYFWASWEGPGLEQMRLRLDATESVAHGLVMGVADGLPFRLHYKIKWGADWHTRKVVLELHTLQGVRELSLKSDGRGHWRDEHGDPLPELDSCLDVDISVTPFTNTLPVRRLDLEPGRSAELRVVYIAVPALTAKPAEQRYRCRERKSGRQLVTYEGLSTGFKADLELDADGLVIDYPGIFRRLAPR